MRLIFWLWGKAFGAKPGTRPPAPTPAPTLGADELALVEDVFADGQPTECGGCHEPVNRCICLPEAS